MLYSSQWGAQPGLTAVLETFEAAIRWGPDGWGLITGGNILAATIDSGNTPTSELRVGLVMGIQTSTGSWTNYSPTATDGSEVAQGILVSSMRMTDIITGVAMARFYGVMVAGLVQGSKLLGLDNQARQQMADRFIFDDDFIGRGWYPFRRNQTKTASYQITAADNLTHFDNLLATGAVTFTLPPILPGYFFGFTAAVTNQNLAVTSSEGANIIAFNNIAANTLTFSGAGAIAGGSLRLFTNPAGTKWYAESVGNVGGTNTVTVS